MPSKPMEGIRVLEVAQFTFVPAAGAVLADWGADVIKIEHAVRGDAMRGLASSGTVDLGGGKVHALLEHSNRGKRSIGSTCRSPRVSTCSTSWRRRATCSSPTSCRACAPS